MPRLRTRGDAAGALFFFRFFSHAGLLAMGRSGRGALERKRTLAKRSSIIMKWDGCVFPRCFPPIPMFLLPDAIYVASLF